MEEANYIRTTHVRYVYPLIAPGSDFLSLEFRVEVRVFPFSMFPAILVLLISFSCKL